eukprot:scaffold8036_cov128-Isochrysis_galbana.AAC.4
MCVNQPPDGVGGGCVGARTARHDLARGWLGPFTPATYIHLATTAGGRYVPHPHSNDDRTAQHFRPQVAVPRRRVAFPLGNIRPGGAHASSRYTVYCLTVGLLAPPTPTLTHLSR